MASLRPSWLSSLNTINTISSPKSTILFPSPAINPSKTYSLSKPFKISLSLSPSNPEPSRQPTSPNPPDISSGSEQGPVDPVKLAFARANAYKKSVEVESKSKSKFERDPVERSGGIGKEPIPYSTVQNFDGIGEKSVELSGNSGTEHNPVGDFGGTRKKSIELSMELKTEGGPVENSGGIENKSIQLSLNSRIERNPVRVSDGIGSGNGGSAWGGGAEDVPISIKIAMEKAKEYKKNKGIVGGGKNGGERTNSGLRGENGGEMGHDFVEKKINKKEELSISSIDFVGLGFADKKEGRGLPAGLVPIVDNFPEGDGDLPEVEIIVGDTSKFEDPTTSKLQSAQEENSDLYKPKVSTWGVFARPSNISKTFGGGRVIRPGDVLETAEDRAAKEERTRQLLAAYKKKFGLNVDAKLKSECEKTLRDGDFLMDSGKLKEALSYFEDVINKLPFQSELHGLAALQWSICQDSLTRTNEARIMYEKLQSHPNAKVSKKARELMFSFQAMEMMKFTRSTPSSRNTGYQNYFEVFVEDKTTYPLIEAEVEEGALNQALPYMIFLAAPIFIVLFIAVRKGI